MRYNALNIEASYGLLAYCQIDHDYYEGGICRDAVFSPSKHTAQVMKRLGIFLKAEAGGFSVLYKRRNANTLSELLDENTVLSFYIDISNPYFLSFSELPLKTDSFFQFSNLEGKGNLLHKSASVSEEDLCAKNSGVVSVTAEKEELFKVENATGTLILEESLQQNETRKIDLSAEADGFYRIISGGESNEVYKTDGKLHFGVIDLHLNHTGLKGEQLLFDKEQVLGSNFKINFIPRTTIWKYIVIDSSGKELYENYRISGDRGNAEFGKPETITLANGKSAQQLTSKTEIVCKETQPQKYILKIQKTFGQKNEMEVALPLPTVGHLKPDPDGGYCSEIFIYL